MKRKWFALLVALIVILSFIFVIKGQVKDSKIVLSTEVLGFPLKLVSEKKISSTPYTWEGKLLIPVVSYSKENLDKIILWYSNRHPKGDGKIILTIFTDENALGIEDRFVGTGVNAL